MKNDEAKKIVDTLKRCCCIPGTCDECMFYPCRDSDCTSRMGFAASNLIEHQSAEIEALKNRIADMSKAMMYNARQSIGAVPVRHGHWILDYEDRGIEYCRCSECNHGDEHAHGVAIPYCWFCGAKMEM